MAALKILKISEPVDLHYITIMTAMKLADDRQVEASRPTTSNFTSKWIER